MNTTATPRPWPDNLNFAELVERDNWPKNRRLIIKAVNNHAALVAALKYVQAYKYRNGISKKWIDVVSNALTRAEKQSFKPSAILSPQMGKKASGRFPAPTRIRLEATPT